MSYCTTPYEQGASDSYYHRYMEPNHYVQGEKMMLEYGTDEYWAYVIGYEENELIGEKKDFGVKHTPQL